MTAGQRSALLEQVVSAHRERDDEGRPVPPPAWWDLSPADMEEVVRRQLAQRVLERAFDPAGLSATVVAVLRRIS